jgi:hypothetical protein
VMTNSTPGHTSRLCGSGSKDETFRVYASRRSTRTRGQCPGIDCSVRCPWVRMQCSPS